MLLQARRLTNADAGSIYMIYNPGPNFSYIHNDTLFGAADSNKYTYSGHTLPIDDKSLVGYVALTGEALKLDDVYHLPPDLPFSFNKSFDESSGYRTRSILVVPLRSSREKMVGVLELINALGEGRQAVPFTNSDRLILNDFADKAGGTIERARLTREIILRMIRMCELRDPEETGPHRPNRVGAYAAEVYRRWARNRGLSQDEIRLNQDLLPPCRHAPRPGQDRHFRSDFEKPAGLDSEEFNTMKFHTIYGARLFENASSDLDEMAAEIALNHHEKWDGGGYPGHIEDIFSDRVSLGRGKQGEEIPLCARIVALADVYDALGSKRSYKEPLHEDQILEYIEAQSGKHFDPEVVRAHRGISSPCFPRPRLTRSLKISSMWPG